MERGALGDPGVDDEEVDGAVDSAGFVERRGDALGIGDIALDDFAAMTIRHRLQRLDSPPKKRQLRAGFVQMGGGGGADAGASTGDQRVAPGKRRLCHLFPSFRDALAERLCGGKAAP